ncbi:hypothetical protein [Adhaeribacter rhizoryzae]|uniref:Uncharacterized protein n=1 Tax=Adhaeribacter rhizoryzae TaxID=2607907 RepID=A0A5M6DKY9_9BACT|nr:hypothetical protein [Adhaeribacter rhizoryzae]KAA5548113.1 hypothetical protein F0145_05135 [Adhaeribacter rhizoryzae]
MFTNISWANYLLVVTLLLIIYYLVIGFRFYFYELKAFISGLRKPSISPEHTKTSRLPADNHSPGGLLEDWPEAFEIPNSPGNQLHNPPTKETWISSEQKFAIAEAAQKAKNKEEFIQIIQLILVAYPGLKVTTFRSAIQDLIMAETEIFSSFSLTEADFEELWLAADTPSDAERSEESIPVE